MTEPTAPMVTTLLVSEDAPVSMIQNRRVELPSGLTIGSLDSGGIRWYLTELVGWDGAPSTGTVTQRTYAHGGWTNEAFFTPRTVRIRGVASGDPNLLYRAADRLMASVPLDDLGFITVTEPGVGDRIAAVRQQGDPLVEWRAASFHFDIELVAPDPRRYSAAQFQAITGLPSTTGGLTVPFTVPFSIDAVTTAGRVFAVNEGSSAAPAVIRIDGPVQVPTVRHVQTGASITLNLLIGTDQFVNIDLGTRRVLLGGTASRRAQMQGTWFELAPGLNEIAFSAIVYDPLASMTVTWRSAWK